MHAADFFYVVSYLFEHFADLAITSFDDRYFEPGIVAFANQFYLRGSGANSASTFFGDRDATAQFVELRFVGNARDFHYVLLGHVRRGFHQRVRQRAVVGQEQQAFTGPVESAYWVYAAFDALYQIHDRGAMFGIADGGHVAFGLVENDVGEVLGRVKELAVYADVVVLGIGFAAEFGYWLAVDKHAAGGD